VEKFAQPDPQTKTDVEIVADNIRAVATLYYIYQHERMRVFQVVDRIADLFAQGLLPISRSSLSDNLRALAFVDDGLTETERADLYEWALGAPGGSADIEPNADFNSLWILFVAEVAAYGRERGASELVWPVSDRNATLRKAARDLATNVSLHGWGMANEAQRIAGQLRQAFDVLRAPELQQAFGVRDAWQVIDRVNRAHLGGAVDVGRYWRLADAGRRIFEWLVAYGETHGRGPLNDADCVEACEAWLAVSGAADEAVDQMARPTETPTIIAPTTVTLEGPALVRELLESMGLAAADRPAVIPDDGTIACFHGEPRAGKTLAAYLIAHALNRSLVRVDLTAMATKTLGAIEKHLAAAFYAAEQVNGILLFDDAAPLFGRRTVTAHIYDRYANLDVPALVQKMEAYPGLVILATNMHLANDGSFAPKGRKRTWRVLRFPRVKR
jgi:hypothetical protein